MLCSPGHNVESTIVLIFRPIAIPNPNTPQPFAARPTFWCLQRRRSMTGHQGPPHIFRLGRDPSCENSSV